MFHKFVFYSKLCSRHHMLHICVFSCCCLILLLELVYILYNHGPLARYVKLRVAHVPGMTGTFSPPPTSKEIAIYRSRRASRQACDARAIMHVGIDNPRCRGKRPRHSRCMRNQQFCVSGKRPMEVQANVVTFIMVPF